MAIKAVQQVTASEETKALAESEFNVLKAKVKKSNGINIGEPKWVSTRNCFKAKTDYRLDADAWEGLLEGLGYRPPVKKVSRSVYANSFNFKKVGAFTINVSFDPIKKIVSLSAV